MNGPLDRQADIQTDGWMDAQMNVKINEQTYSSKMDGQTDR